MSQLSDTSPEAERVLVDVYRRMSVAEKWQRMGEIYRRAKTLHAMGVRMRLPEATPKQIHEDWLALTLGKELLQQIREARRGAD
jgi:hypothetical protein